jgi:2-(1,2-epoxy-1,2-dihydrophenyl)acetyl-CoA isomerase
MIAEIDYTVSGGVAEIILNRPDKMNALTLAMREYLRDLFASIKADPAIRAVLISARGRAFCAGADVQELEGNDTRYDFDYITNPLVLNLHGIGKPVVCAVNGLAVGLGWSVVLGADVIIAAESARFSQVFRKIGLAPDGGAVWFLTRMMGTLAAKELVLSARTISATEAQALGLASQVVADDLLLQTARAAAADLALGPTMAFRHTKTLFEAAISPSLEDYLKLEADLQCELAKSQDHREGLKAFAEKRPPIFKGA